MTTPRKKATSRSGRSSRLAAIKPEHRIFIYGAAATVLVLLVFWAAIGLFSGPPSPSSGPRRVGRTVDPTVDASPNIAVLFYVDEDGTTLVEQEIDIPLSDTTLARARTIAERQLTPPPPPLISPFPEGTELRAVYLTPGGDAFVDLSAQVSLGHPGGSVDELFTVYALVNALTHNVPEIAAVQILIEGKEVDTLAGHVDLRRPLGLNLAWVSGNSTISDDDREVEDTTEEL
jgi:spore germination protein GerM